MAPKRISMSLFDDELKTLINASAKIFPITQEMVDTNSNPEGYEYGKIDRSIYKWFEGAWDYIVADDVDIKWTDVQEKPSTFPPSTHEHADLHNHTNKTVLDTVTQVLIDAWNTAVSHVSDAIRHITSEERTLWNTVSTHGHADLHNHTNKTALDKLVDTGVEATYDVALLKNVSDIMNGYTEGHAHGNFTLLDSITQADVDLWNEMNTHTHDDRYYTEGEMDTKLAAKADSTTLSGHTSNTTVHVTQLNKDAWDGKADALHNHTLASLTEKSYNSLTDKPTIPSAYTHPSTHPASMITGLPTSLPANGGNADTVDGQHASAFATASHTHSYVPLTGGTMTGILYPQQNTSYTTGQARRIIYSTGNPSGGGNGDMWVKYT